MICCLPVCPGNAAVRRADWMTSLALRRYTSPPGSTTSAGSSRARTSCWVIVDAPRPLPWTVATAAETMAVTSKPSFSQNVRSSAVVVASSTSGGTSR